MNDYKYIRRVQYCRDQKCPAGFGRTCRFKGKCENQSDFSATDRRRAERR